MFVINFVFSSQSLHNGVSLILSIEHLMALTRRACSWAANKRLSVSCVIFPLFCYSELHPSSVLSVSLMNCTWRASSFHSTRRWFLIFCLFWTFINFLSFSSIFASLTRLALLQRAYIGRLFVSLVTHSSVITGRMWFLFIILSSLLLYHYY